jgi:starch-binding outer membrane protein, SusD/RagB family
MIKNISITGFLLMGVVVLMGGSCNKDFLNKGPLDQYSDENVWKDSSLITRFVADIYSNLITTYDYVGSYNSINQGIMPADITDEAQSNFSGSNADLINQGQYNASTNLFDAFWSLPGSGGFHQNGAYENIRKCNTFLSHLDDMPVSVQMKQQMTGEVKFLRAYNYQLLYSIFGPFPIVDKVLSITDDLNIPRGTEEACRAFIISDLDAAATLLPVKYNNPADLGRITKGAAIGMKCRLLLNAKQYAAASAAALEIIHMNAYQLFPDYGGIFYPQNDDNAEVIFNKEFGSDQSGQTHTLDLYQNSSFFTGFFSPEDVPTQNMVDQYLMTDGLPWDKSPLYDPAHPYAKRDPRLEASIIYDGTTWRGQVIDMQLGSAFNPVAGSPSLTGYMFRKFLNPNYVFYGNNTNYQNCVVLRLAEIYLNYAECQLKLGFPEEARTYVNLLRRRAQMPEIKPGEMTWDAYVRERTVELAFEGERRADIRRWDMGPQLLGTTIYGVAIETVNGVRQYNRKVVEKRVFEPKMYYFPIPLAQLQKYPAGKVLAQNQGW